MSAAAPAPAPAPAPADPAVGAGVAGEGGEGAPAGRWTRRVLILGALAACGALALWLLPTGQWLKAAVGWVDDLGPWAWVAFVLVYALFSTLAIPTSPLNIAAGLLFGAVSGFLAALAAVSLSAIVSFWIARHAARDWVLRRLNRHPKYGAVVRGLRHDSWKMILLTRLNPVLPSAVANYCFGVTTVRFRTYATASVIGNAPLCFLLAYLGSAGQLTFGGEKHKPTPAEWGLYAGGLAATVALTWWVTRYTRRKMREYEEQNRPGVATPRGATEGMQSHTLAT